MELRELKLTERRLQICRNLGLQTAEDVLRYYPCRYESYQPTPYAQWQEKSPVFFEGEVISPVSRYRARRGLTISRLKVLCEGEEIRVTLFNQPWHRLAGKVTIVGKYDGNNRVTATQISQKSLEEKTGIEAFYPLKDGIKQNDIRKMIAAVYAKTLAVIEERIPENLHRKHQLLSIRESIEAIHFPQDSLTLRKAIARFKYEEFLHFYLALAYRKEEFSGNKTGKKIDQVRLQRFVQGYSFRLTGDQEKAVKDILADLASSGRMSRLLQGDVGCGKTAVAEISLFANYTAGYQGAFMAPTEILAIQHYRSAQKIFAPFGVRVGLLTASSQNAEEIRLLCEKGEIDILIGTHALFADKVIFRKLGLVITDEQHRFGVTQRRRLQQKGQDVDVLLMSATPIPRTLAATLFGDMEITTIASLPEGRKGCETVLLKKNSIRDVLPDILHKLEEGRQVYVIAASIDTGEEGKLKDAVRLYRSLSGLFAAYRVGLLHGKMSSSEKETVMTEFEAGICQVLVSTTVVEVGVNVANASVMVIYDADRFGLSQLHQLRGRVQRSSFRGLCYLLTDSADQESLARLQVLVKSNDGFAIAEEDLRLRGPGDLLGTRQSGLPSFVLGNPVADTKILQAAREDADFLFRSEDPQDLLACRRIREFLRRRAEE